MRVRAALCATLTRALARCAPHAPQVTQPLFFRWAALLPATGYFAFSIVLTTVGAVDSFTPLHALCMVCGTVIGPHTLYRAEKALRSKYALLQVIEESLHAKNTEIRDQRSRIAATEAQLAHAQQVVKEVMAEGGSLLASYRVSHSDLTFGNAVGEGQVAARVCARGVPCQLARAA